MAASFVHLHLHTEYSLVDGVVRIKPLVKAVAAAGMPAVAVTDMSNLFAMIKFYKAAHSAGIKPIVGVDLWLRREDQDPSRLLLLCQDLSGYRNLTRLVSRSFTEGRQRDVPMLDYTWLKGATQGLIALSGAREGELGRALLNANAEQIRERLAAWRQLFPDRFYLELQRTGRPGEEEYIHAAVELALATATPVVATNDVRFLNAEDFEAHEARVCIHEGRTLSDPRRPRLYSQQQYLRSPEEMAERFADLPEALANSVEIAKRCNLELHLGENFLPDFPVPQGMSAEDYFIAQSHQGLEDRLQRLFAAQAPQRREPYDQRLQQELKVIHQMGFAGYFLIVADFIRWARENGVPVGPGRGSGAGSLVAYALGITDLDPLAYDLLFERFLNPERVSMPDFDVDFCMEGRDRVIEYVAQFYGRDKVAQIATHGSMAAKAVVRDVGRVLGHPYGFVDKIAKLIPFEIGMTLDKALAQEEDFRQAYEQDAEVKTLVDLARSLEGLARNVGKHAGGVVIAPSTLTDFSPLYSEQGSEAIVTQFDKDDVEAAGLVKFDFLGLRTLTIINWALQTVNRQRAAKGEQPLDISSIPLEDTPTFNLLKQCQTTAVFQLESRGMKDLIKRLQPDRFEDIIALVALFRPGPLQSGMVDDFIDRKHGRARVEYPHPDLEAILKPTYGVILYQEQVMQIAQVLASYTLGGADLLRRAMGKKKPEEMAKQREVFVEGAKKREVDQDIAAYIFDLMEKFAGYGFNKCVHGGTRIIDAQTGEQTTVESLFRDCRPFTIHALGEDNKLHPQRVTDVVWNGYKPVFTLKTAQGKQITATANHPIRTLDGWTQLEDLGPGDRIAAPRRLPVMSLVSWPKHEIIVLAGLLAEGNTCHPSCLYFYSNDEVLIQDFASAVAQFPNTVARIDKRSNGRMEVCASTGRDTRFSPGMVPWNSPLALKQESQATRSGAFLWAQDLDLLRKKAAEKRIPQPIFQLCEQDLQLFLGRLWAGDGFIANANLAVPFYATSSLELAKGVQMLLLRLGIISGIHDKRFKYRGGIRLGYTVHLLGEDSVAVFVERILPHAIGRQEQIGYLQYNLQTTIQGQTSKDTIPAQVRVWVAEERLKAGLNWKELEQASGVSMREFCGKGSAKKRGFRRATIARLAIFFGCKRLESLADSDLFWDSVVAIEPQGMADTYDLTVENDHNFVADGLVVHNSHSAAYALVSYQTAWLKAHYPAAFMAAVLSSDMDNTDKVVIFIDECRRMKLQVVPPAINTSEYRFTVDEQDRVIYGLGAVKGVGEGAIEEVLEERRRNRPFRDLFDLCQRLDLRKLNRRVLESLIRAGALDCLGPGRATLMSQLPEALKVAEQSSRNAAAGMGDLFGLAAAAATPMPAALAPVPEWSEEQRLLGEKETLGLYLTGHPITRFQAELQNFTSGPLARIASQGERPAAGVQRYGKNAEKRVVIAGLVVAVRTRNANRGGRMAFVTLDDRSARMEIRVFPEAYDLYRHLIVNDKVLVVQGGLVYDDFSDSMRINTERILDMDAARDEYAKRLLLRLQVEHFGNGLVDRLAGVLAPYRQGRCSICADYVGNQARARIMFGDAWKVRPTEQLLRQLREMIGEKGVWLEYN